MNYLKIYENLINSRQTLNRLKATGIYERHHIIPKSIGGSNDPFNLILLTPREHYIAHWLLYKIHVKQNKAKMAYGFFMMCSNNKNQSRKITAREYESAKNAIRISCIGINHHAYGKPMWSEAEKQEISERQQGSKNSMYGQTPWNKGKTLGPMPTEQRQKISNALRGRHVDETVRTKISNSHTGKILSEETKEKLRQANLGKKRDRNSIDQGAAKLRGKKQKTLTCPYCGKTGGTAMHRWHFENCREK